MRQSLAKRLTKANFCCIFIPPCRPKLGYTGVTEHTVNPLLPETTMFLIALLLGATPSTPSIPAITWQQPLPAGMDPANATVLYVITKDDDRELVSAISAYKPDGIVVLSGPDATKENIFNANAALHDYGNVLTYIQLPGVGGDLEDGQIVPYGGDPDKPSSNIRTAEFMVSLAGSQRWLGIISATIGPGLSPGGKTLIGPDAEQWQAEFPKGMNGFIISANDVNDTPKDCEVSFGRLLAGGLANEHNAGTDLTVASLMTVANTVSSTVSACGFKPEKDFAGDAGPSTVVLKGSGKVPSNQVVTADPSKVTPPVINTTTKVPQANAAATRKTVATVASIATAGVCAGLGAWRHYEYASGITERDERFGNRDNFSDEQSFDQAWQQATDDLAADGNQAVGLYACSGAALGTLGVTVFLNGATGVGLNFRF